MSSGGTIREQDYIAAQYLDLRPRRAFAVVGLVLLVSFVSVLIAEPSLVGVGVAAGLATWYFAFIPWRARTHYREYKAISEPSTVEVRDEGLYLKSTTGEALMPWAHVLKWRYNSRVVLVYPARNIYYILPRHFFATGEAYAALLATLTERAGEDR